MASTSIVKTKFIQNVLNDEGDRFIKNQTFAIRAKLNKRSGTLLSERTKHVSSTSTMQARLGLRFPEYLRLLDLRKRTKRKGSRGTDAKGYRIYNRFAQGHYYSIARRLQNDFTPEVQQVIRNSWGKRGGGNG